MELRPAPQQPAPAVQTRSLGVTLAVALVTGVVMAAAGWWWAQRSQHQDSGKTEHVRAVASRLRAAGALDEAARMYELALQDSTLTRDERGTQSYALGLLYLEDHRFEPALRWLYEAEAWGGGGDEVGSKIVHTLERLGRTAAAQSALASLTKMNGKGKPERAGDDPVVAELGDATVVRSEVIRALDDLPQELAKQFKGTQGRAEFLHKYVADELLWRKAQRLELDRDPDVQRHVSAALRSLSVAKLLERDVLSKTAVSASEVKNYYDAHIEQFKKATLQTAKPQIEQILRMQRSQEVVQDWVQKESTDAGVKLFEDKMGGDK